MSALLEVNRLKVHFPVIHGMFSRVRETVKAVDDVRTLTWLFVGETALNGVCCSIINVTSAFGAEDNSPPF